MLDCRPPSAFKRNAMTRIFDPDSGAPADSRPTEQPSDAPALPAEQHPFDTFPPEWTSLVDSHENDGIVSGNSEPGSADAFIGEIFAETKSTDIVLAEIENHDQGGNDIHFPGEGLHLFSWAAADGIANGLDVVEDFAFGQDRLRFEDLLADDDSLDLPALLQDGGITVTEQDDGSLLLVHDSQQVEIHHQGSISDDLIHALTGDDIAAAAQVLRQMLLITG